ncbi:hypothetical protein ACFY8S_06520 [Streptomyces hygroscopicus]|uniref:hypothetical protein n=1 Tax=Streptomyces hygroscopicus TaxID=1912 RepID=UPI0036768059
MIKLTWALGAEHVDEWTGDDAAQGAAMIEARVGTLVDASDMKPEAVQHWRHGWGGSSCEGRVVEPGSWAVHGLRIPGQLSTTHRVIKVV